MVDTKNIFHTIIQKKDFKDQKDVDRLIEICKSYPNFKLPYILLLNYQPDIFNQEFWKKGEEFLLDSKTSVNNYFGRNKTEKNILSKNSLLSPNHKIDQKSLLSNFLLKANPKFI